MGKVSIVKHSNKRFSKLQKRGKIKKLSTKKLNMGAVGKVPKHLQKRFDQKASAVDMEAKDDDVDPTDMMEEEDIKLLEEDPNRFLKELKLSYESIPRRFKGSSDGKKIKSMLPIKGKSGIVPQYMEVDEESGTDDENAEEVQVDLEKENLDKDVKDLQNDIQLLKSCSAEELLEMRRERLAACKLKIAKVSNAVIENPEGSINSLNSLRSMLDEKDALIYATKQKLLMISITEIFKDIIPSYKVRTLSEAEKKQKVKKDTKHLQAFEDSLLKQYKHFLQQLEAASKLLSSKKVTNGATQISSAQDNEELGELALKCMCELLLAHPHFNFRSNIIVTLVPFTMCRRESVSDLCCSTLRMLFRQDKLGDVSLEAVKGITRLVKERSYNVSPKVLDTFLVLKLKDIRMDGNENSKRNLTHKEKRKQMSRREFKRNKKMAQLEKELRETEAAESKETKLKFQTEIIKQVFLNYFRILKRAPTSALLAAVLEGLAKFAHLINVEFFDDLIAVLHTLLESGTLNYRQSMHCVETVFTILSGQGEALNIDPLRFYRHLYKQVFELQKSTASDDVTIALNCLHLMIVKRRKKVSLRSVLAFTKRLATLGLQLEHHGSIACLASLRSFLQNHKRVDCLLDADASQAGSGVFLPELEEPEHCNANATALWELTCFKDHYHPTVRDYSAHLACGAPLSGEGHLSQELSRKSPVDLFNEYHPQQLDFSFLEQKGHSLSRKKMKDLAKHWTPISAKFFQEITTVMEGIHLP